MDACDRLFADLHAHLTRDPNARVYLGLLDGLGALPDPSLAAEAARVAAARALLARLPEAAAAAQDFDRRLDLDLARGLLEQEVLFGTLTIGGRTRQQLMPRAGDDLGDPIFLIFVNDPRPAPARLEDILSRIEAAPAHLDAMLARLDHPIARWVQIELTRVEGLPELFETVRAWAAQERWEGLGRLEAAIARAQVALQSYADRLGALPTSTDLHMGDLLARQVVRAAGIGLSLEELHQLATAFLARNRAEVEALRARIVARHGLPADLGVAELQRWLNARYRVQLPSGRLEDVLERYQAEADRIQRFIQERDLFPLPPDQQMLILRTPSFMEPSIPAGAMMPAPPFRPGVRTSVIYLTLSEELLDEHTELSIPTMMIHEGIPGHHLQFAHAAANPSVVRRHVDARDLSEGWTTMLEDYMLDQGYLGELGDEARFIARRDIARLGARVAIDLFFMTGDRAWLDVGVPCEREDPDPFAAAGSLLEAVTGFVPGRVQAELGWYSQSPGVPLAYLAGNHGVWALRAHLGPTTAPAAQDRAFHRAFLEAGNMPVLALRRVLAQRGMLASGA